MPKDYARYVNKPKRPLVKHGWRNRLLLVGLLLFFLGSVGYGYHVYARYKAELAQQSVTLWVKQLKSWFVKAPTVQVVSQLEVDQAPVEEDQQSAEIQFSFYTNLPAMQVPAPQVATPAVIVENNSKIIPIKKTVDIVAVSKPVVLPPVSQGNHAEEKYLLQIAAFRNPTAAGEMRISLLLAGFEVEIVKAMNKNQQIYQLQQGPFAGVAEVKSMQRELKKKGIESVIVKKIA